MRSNIKEIQESMQRMRAAIWMLTFGIVVLGLSLISLVYGNPGLIGDEAATTTASTLYLSGEDSIIAPLDSGVIDSSGDYVSNEDILREMPTEEHFELN